MRKTFETKQALLLALAVVLSISSTLARPAMADDDSGTRDVAPNTDRSGGQKSQEQTSEPTRKLAPKNNAKKGPPLPFEGPPANSKDDSDKTAKKHSPN